MYKQKVIPPPILPIITPPPRPKKKSKQSTVLLHPSQEFWLRGRKLTSNENGYQYAQTVVELAQAGRCREHDANGRTPSSAEYGFSGTLVV